MKLLSPFFRVNFPQLTICTWAWTVSDNGRTFPGAVKGKKIMKVYISDGRHEPLVGKCVFFLREKRDEVTNTNVMVSARSLSCNKHSLKILC